MPLPQLRRIRWSVRAVLTLGVAASVAANILHARPNPVSQVIAAWPPLALLLTVELISRIPVHRRSLAAVRFAATGTIAGIAAWVSYWHMVGVAARYGETGLSPYLMPISVDGLVVVASVSLVELAGRIRALEAPVADGRTVEVQVTPSPSNDGATTAPLPALEPVATVRTDAPAVDGRRPATVDDARRVLTKRPTISRDDLATALREDGLSVSNARAGELRRQVRGERTADGRTPQLQPA
jgi:hypothetical protein